MHKVWFLLWSLFFSLSLLANNTGVIWGRGHLYTLTAPKGWVLDNKSGEANGLKAVFHPEGGSWKKSPTVMYTNVFLKTAKTRSTKDLIELTKANVKVKSPKVKVEDAGKVRSLTENDIVIKRWKNNLDNIELVGYADINKVIVIFVLSGRSEGEFKKAIPSFKELLKSFKFLSHKPEYHGVSKDELKHYQNKAKQAAHSKVGSLYINNLKKLLEEPVQKAMAICKKEVPTPQDFHVVFEISTFGMSIRTLWTSNETAECFMKKGILNWVFPKPPGKEFYYHLEVKI